MTTQELTKVQEGLLKDLRLDGRDHADSVRQVDRTRRKLHSVILTAQVAGLTYRQIATASGLTVGRVHQIVKGSTDD